MLNNMRTEAPPLLCDWAMHDEKRTLYFIGWNAE